MWPLIKLLPEKTNFRYVAFAPFLGALSLIACIASLYLTLVPFTPPCGGLNCGVDFQGGSLIEFSTAPRQISLDDQETLRARLNRLGIGEVQVQGFQDATAAMARYETPAPALAGFLSKAASASSLAIPESKPESPTAHGKRYEERPTAISFRSGVPPERPLRTPRAVAGSGGDALGRAAVCACGGMLRAGRGHGCCWPSGCRWRPWPSSRRKR